MQDETSAASDDEQAKRDVARRLFEDLRDLLREELPGRYVEQAERLLIDLACAYGDVIATVRVAALRWAKGRTRQPAVSCSGVIDLDYSDVGGEG